MKKPLAALRLRLRNETEAFLSGLVGSRNLSMRPAPRWLGSDPSIMQWGGEGDKVYGFDPIERFRDHPWIYIPANRIATTAAMLPLEIRIGEIDGESEPAPPDHPARMLFGDPNDWQSRFDFFYDLFLFDELCGEAPILLEGVVQGASGGTPFAFPESIAVGRPDKISGPKEDGSWRYSPGGAYEEVAYRRDEVVFIRRRDPATTARGLSPYRSAHTSILQDRLAIRYNVSQLKRGGIPNGILEQDGGVAILQEPVVDAMMDRWVRSHLSPDASFRPAVLHGGLKWKATAQTPRDMQYDTARRRFREEMLGVGGVPAVEAGLLDVSAYARATAEVQTEVFWRNSMMPRLERAQLGINSPRSGLMWRFISPEEAARGRSVFIRFDTSGVKALQEDKEARATRFFHCFDRAAATPDDLREFVLDLPRENSPESSSYYLGGFQAGGGEEDGSAESRAYKRIGLERIRSSNGSATREIEIVNDPKRISLFADQKARERSWRLLNATWYSAEGRWRGRFRGYFKDAEERTLERLKRLPDTLEVAALTPEMLIDPEKEADTIGEEIRDVIESTTAAGGRWGARLARMAEDDARRSGADLPAAMKAEGEEEFLLDPDVANFISDLEQKLVRQVSARTWMRIRNEIAKAQAAGETTLDVADRLRRIFKLSRSQHELTRIARTEIVKASNGGAMHAYRQSGAVTLKEWMSARDDVTRADHLAADMAAPIPLEASWSIGNSALMYPGDPSGEPADIIHCRCATAPVIEI